MCVGKVCVCLRVCPHTGLGLRVKDKWSKGKKEKKERKRRVSGGREELQMGRIYTAVNL